MKEKPVTKRCGIWLTVIALLILAPLSVSAGDRHRSVWKSFFSVNPSLRAEVLALEAVEQEDSLMRLSDINGMPPGSLPVSEKWNGIAIYGLNMSLSRIAWPQEAERSLLESGDDEEVLRNFWSRLLQGSIRSSDMDALGGILQPQLNVDIEF